ncbi:MAG TPA: UvrB/UvrC motif-containing protein [Gemmatimonadaceae bacterium]|nr:UvrB/UvrC motif-containing protein [Gemmatimonadaceae bacterium]
MTQVVADTMTTLHLCEKCAAEKGVETTVNMPVHTLTEFIQAVQKQLPTADAPRCPFCSATIRDFKATGRLGCARCYTAFEPSLRDLLRRVHGNSRHLGKKYQPPEPRQAEGATVLSELRERLRRAIDAEQFEVAAKLRDQIKVLE